MRWILTTLGLSAGLCGNAQETIVRNWSFEDGAANRPAEWSFNHRRTTGDIAWDQNRAVTGKASVRITNKSAAETGNVVQSYHFDPPLPSGSRIAFSAHAAAHACQGTPRIVMQLYSTTNLRQNATADGIGGTHDFQELSETMTVANPSNRLSIYLCNYHVGTAWWDDVTVTVERRKQAVIADRPAGNGAQLTLTTRDGFELSITDTGAIARVQEDEQDLANAGRHSGLWLQPFAEEVVPVTGKIARANGRITQHFEGLDLRIAATYKALDDHIVCGGTVTDLSGTDRALDLWFSLPVGASHWRWGQSVRDEVVLQDNPMGTEAMTFSSLSDPSTTSGLALAVPADSPCDCVFTHDPTFGYAVRFRFGLSPEAGGSLKSCAPFHFVVYRCDPAWGLRDAARRYYALYPRAFEKRVTREGLWLFGNVPKWLPDPQNYAFHEGGTRRWEYDDRHGLATCPYIIPGQREIPRLPELPASKQEAMAILKAFEPKPSRKRRGWGTDIKQIIEACHLLDHQAQPQVRIRTTSWGGPSITFPLNGNPELFSDSDRPTVARALLDTVRGWVRETPSIDGIYVDSMGAWGDYTNHRREHFRYTRIPLSYDPANGKPVQSNQYSLLEFLHGLGKELHPGGRLVFANGLHQTRKFHFFATDILGVEGKSCLDQKRVMACQKPFLLLIYNIHDDPAQMTHYFHLCTLYGIYPAFANMRMYKTPEMYEPVHQLNNRFVPMLQRLTKAGWHPITHARSDNADIWLERWGTGSDTGVYLTVYNATDATERTTLAVNATALGLGDTQLTARDILSDGVWQGTPARATLNFTLEIPPEQTRVLQLSRELVQSGE